VLPNHPDRELVRVRLVHGEVTASNPRATANLPRTRDMPILGDFTAISSASARRTSDDQTEGD
jgi:hypothetical protein